MSGPTCREVFAALPGAWDLDRTFEPAIGTMRGVATFTPADDAVLAYREDGELRRSDGFTGPVYREYRWVLVAGDTDERIDVLFAADRWSGGLMHTLRLDPTGTARDVHHCDADDYTGTYAFTPPDLVVITMDVRGPAKDYTICTTLRRRGSPRTARSRG